MSVRRITDSICGQALLDNLKHLPAIPETIILFAPAIPRFQYLYLEQPADRQHRLVDAVREFLP